MKYYQIVFIFVLMHVHNFVFCSQEPGSPSKSCLRKTSAYEEASEGSYQLQPNLWMIMHNVDATSTLNNTISNSKFSPLSIAAINQSRQQSPDKIYYKHSYFFDMEEVATAYENKRLIEQQQRMKAIQSTATVLSAEEHQDVIQALLSLHQQKQAEQHSNS